MSILSAVDETFFVRNKIYSVMDLSKMFFMISCFPLSPGYQTNLGFLTQVFEVRENPAKSSVLWFALFYFDEHILIASRRVDADHI